MQLRDLREYCGARNLTITHEYVDWGESGSKDSRPQLNNMMSDARKRKVDMILVWRWDRFARSVRHLLNALEEFRTLKINFVSFQEDIDTSTPIGQMLFTVMAAMAELERNLIIERVCSGIRNARARGARLGRPRRYVDNDRIVEMRAGGQSLRQIAATLRVGYGTIRERLQSSERKSLSGITAKTAPSTGISPAL